MTAIGSVTPITSTGIPSAPTTPSSSASSATAPVSTSTASASSPTSYDTTDAASANAGSASGGGLIGDFANGVLSLVNFAQQGMDKLQTEMSSLTTSEGGNLNPATLTQINMQMSNYQLFIEQAKQFADSKKQAAQIWVQN